mmetsp:Transcript_9729/g.31777  ORF Transcript_9729/g.31777 Transcript_9729/m.31777 type:complete len:304 (+) Transcript_9729:359-1270(+)
MAVPRHCGYDKQTIMRVKSHDIIADCSDNVGTRYFLNDACLLAGKILVVAAALGTEGSLTRWNYSSGPCYRCVSPAPSHHESHRQCADDGVLGPVPGALGALQALDILHCLSGLGNTGSVLRVFDGFSLRPFRLPPKRRNCALCGVAPSLVSLADSEKWAQTQGLDISSNNRTYRPGIIRAPSLPPLPAHNTATALDLKAAINSSAPCLIIDVRNSTQFSICKLPNAISLPLRGILQQPKVAKEKLQCAITKQDTVLFILCRRGIDSCFATHTLLKLGFENVRDVVGGLDAWRRKADPTFPLY